MLERRPIAFVTGASGGIGRAVAVELGHHGYDLVLTSREPERLDEAAAAVEATGATAHRQALRLEDADDAANAIERAEQQIGPLAALVNNAAAIHRGAALDLTVEEWDSLFDTNLRGPFLLCRAFARLAHEAGRAGAIVNVGSTHGRAVLAGRSAYGVTKAALDHLTRSLAVEWAPYGIRVNAVVPATVATPSREVALSDPEVRAAMTARIPLGRFATPEEVASAVRYLLSSDASFVTGTCLLVDGGVTAQ